MTLFWMFQAALIITLCASTVDVSTINVSCSDIQRQEGFQFKYDRPPGAEILVHHGKTLIGSLEIGKQPKLSSEVIRLDNKSVFTKQCRDLLIKVFTVKDRHVKEHRLSFKVTANSDNPVTPSSQVNNTQFIQENTTEPVLPTPESHTAISSWIAYLIGALIVVSVIIIGVFLYFYLSWKKKMSFPWPCNALKKCISTKAESSETQETRPLSGIEMQILDTVNQQNGNSLENIPATEPSATEPSGSGEDGVAQDSPHGSVHVVSIQPQCNGLDHKLGNEEFN
ncbi:uncharacterized protein LOC118123899 isoform X2 [Hippoglossus stenolepis]|uniref:uncharacterized protein LOC118123899 isoform X2 n=1 Tax=Hippoglossus stenolepis TaxID=195615 RepID=UPI001FAEE9B5|nr:uncharacterized protein LOC118123899 isoform X2 [Hippoglossus stenolepis]